MDSKLIQFAQILFLSTALLSSCAKRPTEIKVVQAPRPTLDLPLLTPLQLDGVQWSIITENNYKEIFAKLKDQGYQPILFSLNEAGYEKLSINMTKIRGHMAQQKAVIAALKSYYNISDDPQLIVPSVLKPVPPVKVVTDKKEVPVPTKQPEVPKKGLARTLIPFLK